MLQYVSFRLLQGVVVIFLVSITSFIIMQLAPGSPVDIMIGEQQVTLTRFIACFPHDAAGFRIDDEDLEDLKTVRDAVDYVFGRVGA